MSVILAYIPVLHQGYYQLFLQNSKAKTLYLLSNDIASQFTPIHKEIRALDQNLIITAIKSWNIFENVLVADETILQSLSSEHLEIIIPDEIITNEVVKKYLPNAEIVRSSIFLRWDKASATKETQPESNYTISNQEAAIIFIQQAIFEGNKSSDWWRQVGAIAVKDGKIIKQTHNTHLPTEQQPYVEGDPRAHFHKGDHIELTTAIHAEAKLIAEAAAIGTALKGAELFVTDFPCPVCAKSIVSAGFKKVYFVKGYAMLDGERLFKQNNIEIVQVIV